MLVNYKKANIITIERGEGKAKLTLKPGINVIDDEAWKEAERNLAGHIKAGLVVPIYKVEKQKVKKEVKGKDGKVTTTETEKEVNLPCGPDDIPNDKIDEVVAEIASEEEADKFVAASSKESVRTKGMNRKNKIAQELKDRESK